MTRRTLQALLAGLVAVTFAASGYLIYQRDRDAHDAVAIGQRVLDAKLLGLDGQPLDLARWRGKVLVVNFWATWCTPCREEIPEFIKLQANLGGRGVQFVGIAIDQSDRVRPYATEMGINYPLLVGGLETMDFARQLGNRQGVLPFSLVLDRNGSVANTTVGLLKPEKLEPLLLSLLR